MAFLCTRIHFNLALHEETEKMRSVGGMQENNGVEVSEDMMRKREARGPIDWGGGEAEQWDEKPLKRLVGGHSQHEGGVKEQAFSA